MRNEELENAEFGIVEGPNLSAAIDYTVQQIFSLKKLKNKQVCFRVICGH